MVQYKAKNIFLIALLSIGVLVEGTNLADLFYKFMLDYRPNWYELFNHLAALGFASFWLLSIIWTGIYGEKTHSWGLAGLCMLVSLYVYKDIASFSFEKIDFTHRHTVVLLQSIVLPYFVAYYTHKLAIELGNYRKVTRQEQVMTYMQEAYELIQMNESQRQGMKHISEVIPQVMPKELPKENPQPQPQEQKVHEKPAAATQEEHIDIFELLEKK
jgi:hypothetical protein